MSDELKKADEIVRALRDPENCDVLDYIDDAAYLIDSLTAQLNEEISRRYQAECNYDHWKQQALESERMEKEAVADIWNASMNAPCAVCAHGFANTGAPCTVYPCKFEWRGARKEQNDGQ